MAHRKRSKKYLEAKRRLWVRLSKVLHDFEQLVRDVRYWNHHRPDAAPYDVGRELVGINLLKQMLLLVDSDQRIPDELWNRFMEHLEAGARG